MEAREIVLDAEKRTVEFPFSSERPVDRYFGKEILSHESTAVDLERASLGALPLLFNHDMDSLRGKVERVWMGPDKRLWAQARFAKTEDGQEALDLVKDGMLPNVSFGYVIEEMRLTKTGENGMADEYTATKWSPYEVSLVTVPADPGVGIGRDSEGQEFEVNVIKPNMEEGKKEQMEQKETQEITVDSGKVHAEAVAQERSRVSQINALGAKFEMHDLARTLVDSGKSLEEAKSAFLEKLGYKQIPLNSGAGHLDLTPSEKKSYSIVRAIRASITGDWKEAGFERECSKEIAKRNNKETTGFFMPMNVSMSGTRATYAVGAAATGGNLVETSLLDSQFIDILRSRALVVQMGARMLSGLVGNVAIPRQNVATAVAWVTEGNAPAQAEATFDQVTMSPKQIAARSQMTRLMIQQGTPDIETLVRNDLAAVIALGIDAAAINGAGTGGVPRGILNQSGIGSVALGTNGAALTIDALIDLEELVATANADIGALGYMTTPRAIAALKKLKGASSGDYLWTQAMTPAAISGTPGIVGAINGYPFGRTTQVPSNLTKGTGTNLHAVIFGNFNDLLIGEWGVLEILPNPYGAGYNAGSVDIRAMATVDVAVRQAASFAAITDAVV